MFPTNLVQIAARLMARIFLNEVYPPLGVGECVDSLVIEAALVPACDDDDML